MTTQELAKLVIQTLDCQRQYFKTRSSGDLEISKGFERKLRREAEACLDSQRKLFGETD